MPPGEYRSHIHSAQTVRFLPRDATHSADYAVARCLSVRYRRYSVETAKSVIKLFLPSGSHTILVFAYQTLWQYSGGDPLMVH